MHTLTIKSDKPLVLIPADEYESMRETLDLLAGNPNLFAELTEARRQLAKGNSVTWVEFKKKHKVK